MNCPACDTPNADGARYCAKCGALMPVAHVDGNDPMIGTVVGGRYRITSLLGEGGMGRVYTGEQQMGTAVRRVAVKTLLEEFSKDPQVVARFMRECGTVVELEHPNTIKFYDFGQTDSGDLYIAMEFVDGAPLADVIEKDGALSHDRVLKIMDQTCGSLHEAHEKGIVHRDLKPENVILTSRAGVDDFVKVLDFGIAKRNESADAAKEQKLTQAGMVLGTPPYMSPEQFTGKELDRRSDIYSLGVMAYEMATGQLPFKANTPWEWATQHMTAQPFPFEQTGPMAAAVPPGMKQAIMRALSKDRDQRHATAKEFIEDLKAGGAFQAAAAANPSAAEAFTSAVAGSGAGGAPGGGTGTQMQPAFTPPGATQAGGAPPTMAGPAVPAAGPAPAPTTGGSRDSGGGGKGGLIAAAIVVALLLVGGGVYALKGDGGDEDETDPVIPIATSTASAGDDDDDDDDSSPSASASASGDGGSAPTGDPTGEASAPAPEPPSPEPPPPSDPAPPPPAPTPTPGPKPPPPKPAGGTAACNQAISAALSKSCSAARSAMSRCTGPKQSIAQINVNKHCGSSRFRRRSRRRR